MQHLLEKLFDELHSCWRFRWWALCAAGVIAALGWLVVFALPDRYEAQASVFVDTRTALKPVLQGLTMGQDVDSQLNFVRQSLLAGDQLRKLAEQTGVLPSSVKDPVAQDEILTALAERVEFTVRGAGERGSGADKSGSIYSVIYRDSDRERSRRVVQLLMDTLVQQTLGGKREDAESAQKFLETQIKNYDQRLREAEDRLASFKKKNIGFMPTEQGGSFTQLQTELDQISKLQGELSIAVSRRSELQRQLRGEAVNTASGAAKVVVGTGTAFGNDTNSRINEAQAKLDELLLRFTERHPDVIAARQTLEELKLRRAADIERLKQGDASVAAASGASISPVFQSIQLALNQTEVEITTMRGALGQHQAKAADLRKRLDTLPKVEAEYAQLNRDYDVNKAQYTALLSNYEKAKLGEQADNAGSVRFDIVQPPTASLVPVFPKRGLFLAGALLAALAVGGGVAYVLSLFQPVVGSAQSLVDLTGLPVLGTVGSAFPKKLRTQVRSELAGFLYGAFALVAAFVLALMLSRAGVRIVLSTMGKA